MSPNEIVEVLKQDEETKKFLVSRLKKLDDEEKCDNKVFQCSIGEDRIFIDASLNIMPCLMVPVKYNYKNNNIVDSIDDFLVLKDKMTFDDTNKCKSCNKKTLCRYCPGRFFMETGNYQEAPIFYCQLADEIIKSFGDEDYDKKI